MDADARPQLDLFADSRDVMLRNDAITALLRRDALASAAAREALAGFDAGHAALAPVDVLNATLTAPQGVAFASPAEARAAREGLETDVVPAARTMLGADATAWLAPLWRRLAERAAGLAFRSEEAEDHAAALWLQAGDSAAAAEAVLRIESWQRIPKPLGWMIRARHAIDGLDAVWPLLAELAWLAPARFAACAQALADPLLERLLRRYDTEDDLDPAGIAQPLAWFPAWLLNDQPALLPHLRQARPGLDTEPERAFRLMGELLGLERQGRHADLIAGRKRLSSLQPALYAVYMRTR